MKQATLFTILVLISYAIHSRSISTYSNFPKKKISDTTLLVTASINEMLIEIINTTGLQPNFELKEANVPNIEATITRRKRYILYNADFMKRINMLSQDKWNSMALMAHEIGHHLNGHTIRRRGSHHTAELEADEFAGFVLARLGASLKQAQEVMLYIASEKGSSTHPSRELRMNAIRKGWSKLKDPAS